MNLVLDVNLKKNLEPGDILVFNGKEWTNLSKEEYLAKLSLAVNSLEDRCDKIEKENDELKQKVAELRGEE